MAAVERPPDVCYAPFWKVSFSGFPMSLAKVQHKGQMTIPLRIRSAVGLADGGLVDVKADRGRIILTPRTAIDLSKFPNADDEYTPE